MKHRLSIAHIAPHRIGLSALLLVCWVWSVHCCPAAEPAIEFLERKVKDDPDDFIAWNQLGERFLTRLRDTGDNAWLPRAAAAADASLKSIAENANPGGLALRARVDIASHRFADARDRARRLREIQPAKSTALPILFDSQLELGDLAAAEAALADLQRLDGETFNSQTRRARLAIASGKFNDARKHFGTVRDSAQKLTPPQPAIIAWCEVQIGELAFRTGDWERAEKSYAAALVAVPSHWSAREHIAELRAAQGKYDEALALLTEVIAATSRPELLHAAGDVAKAAGQTALAADFLRRASSAMRASAERGEVLYLHHLASLYSDSLSLPADAVVWAERDIKERQSAGSWDALAWALYLDGKIPEAAEAARKSIASGTRDAHILYHAGMILTSAGDLPAGRLALRAAAEINPRQQAFHFHR